jgi:hypothetical protein
MATRTTLETHIYYHSQNPGYQVRKKKSRNGELLYDVSKYFGVWRHGSLRAAASEARRWKDRNITHSSRWR